MKVHFIGIGGIGVSALAQYYFITGHKVSGSDLVSSEITEYLQKLGVNIKIGEQSQNDILPNPDIVIYSPAVKSENSELKYYKNIGVECLSYPAALGGLTKKYFTIAISGSHGKSTTTAMIALTLVKAGLDPTVIIGTKLKEFGNPALNTVEGTNFRMGQSKYLVIEACEYEESFLNYWPKIIVVTNIEAEHLDYFKNLKNVILGFQKFANNLPKDGILIANKEDKNIKKIINYQLSIINKLSISKFSIKQKEAGQIKKILKIPGQHNVYNALATLATARELGISDKIIFKSLSEYNGSWRRFETKDGLANDKKITIVSDYGHHPTEVLTTLKAAREKYKNKNIWCVFQPHQYQRTFYLFDDFVKIFRKADIDNIIITDIYDVAGRENDKIKSKIDSEKLVKKINKKNVIYCLSNDVEKYVKDNIKEGDVLIIMGAGDIYKIYDKF